MPEFRLPGLDTAWQALADGRAVVVPNPSPQAYGIVATAPEAVNAAKHRPLGQDVAVAVHDPDEWRHLARALDLGPASVSEARRLVRRDRMSLLLPLRPDVPAPEWTRPAIRDDHVMVFGPDVAAAGPGWSPVAALWAAFPRLYGSSANTTGHPAATTAAEAVAMFGGDMPVVDGDTLRDPGLPSAPTAVLRMAPDGTTTVVRGGSGAGVLQPGPGLGS